MKNLFNWRFLVDMGCGLDIWCLHGINDDGQVVIPSMPVKIEKFNDHLLLHTYSGSIYRLGYSDCAANLEEHIGYLEDALTDGGFRRVM